MRQSALTRSRRAPLVLRLLLPIAVLSTLLVGVSWTVAETPARALNGSSFDPGYIISDAQFYDSDAMSEAEIQAFLDAKVPTCRPGYTCLKDYRQTTPSKSADPMCAAYTGAANERASTIIAKVSAACGISPRVVLVTLQKEQSLVTDDWPSAYQYSAAMGAGCPDTAGCDPSQAGFFNQVYYGLWYLKRYGAPPGTGPGTPYTSTFNAYSKFSSYAPGATFAIRLSPNIDCGYKNVYIRNQPTASLYTYTPYTPNDAALNNLGSYGDACSSYGNRNFWHYYNQWFGDPTAGLIGVSIDRISGADRYEVAVAISQRAFPSPATAPVVYVATGTNYPDALSAAPVAYRAGGPLLLVQPTVIPASVKAEIQRLRPAQIVVVGGPDSVSESVYAELGTLAASITRLGGADRYEASRAIISSSFTSATRVYVATGENFPDALSAGSPGGINGVPIVLVRGTDSAVDTATRDFLVALGVTQITIVGGPASVSPAMQNSLATIAPTTRLSGVDRTDASRTIADDAFGTEPTEAFIATGWKFPDALAGSVLAAYKGAPLVVVPAGCVPSATRDFFAAMGISKVTLIGGPASLTNNVEYFMPC